MTGVAGADPGFEKGGGAPKTFLANLGDFLKNLGQKGVGVRPLRPLWIRAWVVSQPMT